MIQTVSIWPFLVIGAGAVLLCVTNFLTLKMCNRWRTKARRLEREANDAADRLVQAHKDVQYQSDLLVALNERVDAQDELIASLTAQRDKLSQDVSNLIGGHTRDNRNEKLVSHWNLRNARIPFQSVEDVLSAAYVHGPRGRLTRFVPKEPTVG